LDDLAFYLTTQSGVFVTFCALLGLVLGSFLNVYILRKPRMMEAEWQQQCRQLLEPDRPPDEGERFDLVFPGSHCPHCGHRITALENIPVLSYLYLRGRCSACRAAISFRYPAVELLSAALSGIVAWHYGFGPQAGVVLLLTWSLIALTFIDIDHQLLPDDLTLPLLWLGLACNLVGLFTNLASAVIGAMAGYLLLWSVYHAFRLLTGKQGMGYGDFKLLAVFGAWAGWQMLPLVILMSSLVGAVVGVTLILVKGHDRNIPIPFGPYLAAAGWITLLWGGSVMRAWMGWIV